MDGTLLNNNHEMDIETYLNIKKACKQGIRFIIITGRNFQGVVDAATIAEINEFLKTFFKLYPTATEKELSYYVKDSALKPMGKDYVFARKCIWIIL